MWGVRHLWNVFTCSNVHEAFHLLTATLFVCFCHCHDATLQCKAWLALHWEQWRKDVRKAPWLWLLFSYPFDSNAVWTQNEPRGKMQIDSDPIICFRTKPKGPRCLTPLVWFKFTMKLQIKTLSKEKKLYCILTWTNCVMQQQKKERKKNRQRHISGRSFNDLKPGHIFLFFFFLYTQYFSKGHRDDIFHSEGVFLFTDLPERPRSSWDQTHPANVIDKDQGWEEAPALWVVVFAPLLHDLCLDCIVISS